MAYTTQKVFENGNPLNYPRVPSTTQIELIIVYFAKAYSNERERTSKD